MGFMETAEYFSYKLACATTSSLCRLLSGVLNLWICRKYIRYETPFKVAIWVKQVHCFMPSAGTGGAMQDKQHKREWQSWSALGIKQ